jgi:hypothetical protein
MKPKHGLKRSPKKSAVPIVVHGPREAIYNNLPTQHPMIVCLCGARFEGGNTWEDVGAEFDEHLRRTRERARNG